MENVVTQQTKPTTTPTHQQILEDVDKNVSVWTDYLKTLLHPKSICLLQDFIHNVHDFDIYTPKVLQKEVSFSITLTLIW